MQPRASVEGRPIGWTAAALSAGPVYALIVLGPALLRANATMPVALLFVAPLATAMGLLLGALPIGAAVWIGGWMGTRWPSWRHPAAWGAIGAVAGVAVAVLLDVTRMGDGIDGAVAGAAVAGIARRFVHWTDPIAPDAPAT